MTFPICPCDGATVLPPANLPGLSHIGYRAGTFASFRRAVLTPLDGEQNLSTPAGLVWRTDGAGDLAVMMAEWFAYLADILTFYNERIANQGYLGSADLPESVTRLIRLLGYRPRPAIGAVGVLAALTMPGQSATLPKGLQFQSRPGPGQTPQIFELDADTQIDAPDSVPAIPPPHLLATTTPPISWSSVQAGFAGPGLLADLLTELPLRTGISSVIAQTLQIARGRALAVRRTPEHRPVHVGHRSKPAPGSDGTVLLQGAITTIDPGAVLVLRPRDPALGSPLAATVRAAAVQADPSGGQQTQLTLAIAGVVPTGLSAAQASLERANQSVGLWTFFDGAVGGATVHLASLARQIRPGDRVMFTAPSAGLDPVMAQVTATIDTIWDATGTATAPTVPKDSSHPLPVPHTTLLLSVPLDDAWGSHAWAVTALFDWISVGRLLDQPFDAWTGTPAALLASTAHNFVAGSGVPLIVQDASGAGVQAAGSSVGDGNLLLGGLPDPVPPLTPPFSILYDLLPVSRGKTVEREILGSGDATIAGQSFALAKSPVTYLAKGAGYASTITILVGGQPWQEVANFFGQTATARVFVTREDESGRTYVDFGDGVNGARLPTGTNNVVASYRFGAGAQSPPAGKLTVIAQSFPGLRAILNPVAVGGGADPDPPDQIRRYAPRSVLAFGRAVSAFDYQALAAQAPGVTRASAVWTWDDARQRTLVTVYVGDDAAARMSAATVLSAAGDPNRPVKVVQASEVVTALTLTLAIVPGTDQDAIAALVMAALADPLAGLFASGNLPIGQPLFDSQIEAAVLAVPNVVAITAAQFTANGAPESGPLHAPGEGAYYALDAADIALTLEAAANGG